MPTESTRYQAVREVFHEALTRDPDARGLYLDDACAGDQDLRARVEALLASDSTAGAFLDEPAVTANAAIRVSAAAVKEADDPLVGRRVGAYRVTGVIGTGGMGRVYRAEQDHPARPVALKLLRGAATEDALRRFEYEAHILARLRHPAIAQVYDAGLHDAGGGGGPVPFFAMELVPEARPITDSVRARGLGVRAWLPLFLDVCDAVHHGHQKGVVHRDLKPANILVDADGRVKVIDFGVARVTNSDVALTMMPTVPGEAGGLVGTLAYMSPEQVGGDPGEVDTRSDVYALGVILYELLTGSTPHNTTRRSVPDAIRAIQELPPRRFPPDPRLDDDLRTITLKALEKPRERRYQSAAELAADLRRWLAHEPVQARPPTTLYQLRMFARRHRALVGAAAAVLGVLLAATVVSSVFAVQASRAARAEAAQHARARAINDFLRRMLSSADPFLTGRAVTVGEVLGDAAGRLDDDLAEQPDVRAVMRQTIGRSFAGLGDFERAEGLLRRALEETTAQFGPRSDEAAETMQVLSSVLAALQQFDEAERLAAESLEVRRAAYGERHPASAGALYGVASVELARCRFDSAAPLFRDVLAMQRALLVPNHPDTAATLSSLGKSLLGQGMELPAAEAASREALAIREAVSGPRHPEVAVACNELGNILREQRRFAEAAVLFRRAVDIQRVTLGRHLYLSYSLGNLADALLNSGDAPGAAVCWRESVEVMAGVLGPDHERVLIAENNLASAERRAGDIEGAERRLRSVLERDGAPGSLPRVQAGALLALSSILMERGDAAEAEPLLRERLALGVVPGPGAAAAVDHTQRQLARCLSAQGRHDEAERVLLEHHDAIVRDPKATEARMRAAAEALAKFYDERGRAADAAQWRAKMTR